MLQIPPLPHHPALYSIFIWIKDYFHHHKDYCIVLHPDQPVMDSVPSDGSGVTVPSEAMSKQRPIPSPHMVFRREVPRLLYLMLNQMEHHSYGSEGTMAKVQWNHPWD
jgi:hypothetical protein